MPISSTDKFPDYNFELTDGTDTVSFILTDVDGQRNPRAITEYPVQRMAIKSQEGESKWADAEFPWGASGQDDFSGGEGSPFYEADRRKFWKGYNINTEHAGYIYPMPSRIYYNGTSFVTAINSDTGYQDTLLNLGVDIEQYIARKFIPTVTGTYTELTLWLDRRPDVGASAGIMARCYVVNDNGGAPNMSSIVWESTFAQINVDEAVPPVVFTGCNMSLTAGTAYWIVIKAESADIGTLIHVADNDTTFSNYKVSSDGTTWSDTRYRLPYNLVKGENLKAIIPFVYKGCQYVVKRYADGSASKLYRNGDRGVVSSGCTTTSIVDSTKSWNLNQWSGATLIFPNWQGDKKYRTVQSNGATTLTLSSTQAWDQAPGQGDEYILLDENNWIELRTLPADVRDVAVAGEYVYFACYTKSSYLQRYQEFARYDGTNWVWTARIENDIAISAYHLQSITRGGRTSLYISTLGGSGYDRHWLVTRYDVPQGWGNLYTRHSNTRWLDQYWEDYAFNYVGQSGNSNGGGITFTMNPSYWSGPGYLGALAVNDVDMTKLGLSMEVMSDSAISANDIKITLHDFPLGGHVKYAPVAVWKHDRATNTYTDMPAARDGGAASSETITPSANLAIVIGFNYRFDAITWDFGTANSASGITVTPYIWNGGEWMATTWSSTGTKPGSTQWAQDGEDIIETAVTTYRVTQTWEKSIINGVEAYYMYLLPSGTMTSNMTIHSIKVRKYSKWVMNFPRSITSSEYNHFVRASLTEEAAYPLFFDPRRIQCVSLYYSGSSPKTISIRNLEFTGLPDERRDRILTVPKPQVVNSIGKYSGDASGIERPWILTNYSVWELDDNDNWVEMPLGEIAQLSDGRNGQAWCQNDVYLYFNVGNYIERYYNRNLDDIGLNRMDTDHPGDVVALLSEPGKVYAVFNARSNTRSRYSTIKLYKNSGWHPIYTGIPKDYPNYASRDIQNAFIQNLEWQLYSLLWIQEGDDFFYIRLYENPYRAYQTAVNKSAALFTGWIQTNLADVYKIFSNIKVIFGGEYKAWDDLEHVRVYYMTESSTTWQAATDIFDDYSEEHPLNANHVRAKRIKLFFKIYFGNTSRPIDGWNLEHVTVVPGKYAYSLNTSLLEGFLQVTLNEKPILPGNYAERVETVVAKLKEWANNGTVLTQRCAYSPFDNKKVFLHFPSTKPLDYDSENQIERLILNISTVEI